MQFNKMRETNLPKSGFGNLEGSESKPISDGWQIDSAPRSDPYATVLGI
jgi:hypothetical protein